tara:strand:+ start:20 stop:697 length:678 start_codon:yes stop_codon:yes gene_type:complete
MSFRLNLNNPSKIAELQELEHLRVKFEIAGGATEGLFSRRWVYQNIFKMSEEEVQRIEIDQIGDAKHAAMIESAALPPEGGAGLEGDAGAGLGGDTTSPLAGDAGDLTGGAAPDAAAGEEGPLLAQPDQGAAGADAPAGGEPTPPANRRDKRGMGATRRHMKSLYGSEMASSTMRNIEKGWSDGIGTLINIGESKEDNEEQLIFEGQWEVKKLIEQLESRNESKT